MDRRQFAVLAAAAATLSSAGPAFAEKPPATWDGLVEVPSKKLKLVYLAPGADFRAYSSVMLDPTEVAFSKKWISDYNSEEEDPSRWLSQRQLQDSVKEGIKDADKIFAKVYADGGYPVATAPGPHILRVRTAVINIMVTAPDVMTAGMSMSAAGSAGQATFVIEARDSGTGAILGRAVDTRLAGDTTFMVRSAPSNWGDFRDLIQTWAKASVVGLNELKTLSPIKATAVGA